MGTLRRSWLLKLRVIQWPSGFPRFLMMQIIRPQPHHDGHSPDASFAEAFRTNASPWSQRLNPSEALKTLVLLPFGKWLRVRYWTWPFSAGKHPHHFDWAKFPIANCEISDTDQNCGTFGAPKAKPRHGQFWGWEPLHLRPPGTRFQSSVLTFFRTWTSSSLVN